MRTLSLTFRVTLLFGLGAMMVFSVFGLLIQHSIERHFAIDDGAELNIIAQSVAQILSNNQYSDIIKYETQRFDDILVGHHHAVLSIIDSNNYRIFTSPSAPLLPIDREKSTSITDKGSILRWTTDDHIYSMRTYAVNSNKPPHHTYYYSVAVAIDYHLRFLKHYRFTLWIMITCGILVTSIMGWIAVRQGHAPLRNIVAKIRHISSSELNTRLNSEQVPRELIELAESFNEMLERMEKSFQQLSNFSADIAHELRTPIASLLTQTQVALAQTRNAEDYREILISNIEEYERMAQMVSDMLLLAKTDNRLYEINADDIDLALVIQELFDYYEAWADESGVKLSFSGQARLNGDKSMIRRALSNLLSNAIRHTPRGKSVSLRLTSTPKNGVSIEIENPGPTINPEQLGKLFDRFYRIDPSRQRSSEGTGLGLSIVKSIVELHDGKIRVQSENGITRFLLLFGSHA